LPSERAFGRPGADADALNALLASWLAGYRVAHGTADELLGATGGRANIVALLGALAKLGEADIDQRFASANRRIDEMGVTYRPPAKRASVSRRWPACRYCCRKRNGRRSRPESSSAPNCFDLILRDISARGG